MYYTKNGDLMLTYTVQYTKIVNSTCTSEVEKWSMFYLSEPFTGNFKEGTRQQFT